LALAHQGGAIDSPKAIFQNRSGNGHFLSQSGLGLLQQQHQQSSQTNTPLTPYKSFANFSNSKQIQTPVMKGKRDYFQASRILGSPKKAAKEQPPPKLQRQESTDQWVMVDKVYDGNKVVPQALCIQCQNQQINQHIQAMFHARDRGIINSENQD